MWRGVRWIALSGVVVIAALVGPTAALASDCGGNSSVNIYTECKPSAKGGTHHHNKKPVTQHPTTAPPVTPVYPTQPSTHPATHPHVHRHVIVNHKKVVHKRHHQKRVQPVLASAPTKESSLGPAFDLGSGPLLLIALLAGTVLVLLGTGGVRSWRNRHRV